jgi:hypothetical protein
MSEPLIRATPELWFWACLIVAALAAGALAFRWMQRRLDERRCRTVLRVDRAPRPDHRDSLEIFNREMARRQETRR